MLAVILAEGLWELIVSLTRNLLVPFMAQQMATDPQSPLYLGKGEFNFPAVFVSVLEFCFAGMVAIFLNLWANRGPKVRRVKIVKVSKTAAQPPARPLSIAPPTPPAAAPVQPAVNLPPPPAPTPAVNVTPVPAQPESVAAPAPPKPEKPKPPKEVYYNIVGEPINPTEDD